MELSPWFSFIVILLRFIAVLSLVIIFLPRESQPDACFCEWLSICANAVVIRGFHCATRRHATTVNLPFPRASRPCSSLSLTFRPRTNATKHSGFFNNGLIIVGFSQDFPACVAACGTLSKRRPSSHRPHHDCARGELTTHVRIPDGATWRR